MEWPSARAGVKPHERHRSALRMLIAAVTSGEYCVVVGVGLGLGLGLGVGRANPKPNPTLDLVGVLAEGLVEEDL